MTHISKIAKSPPATVENVLNRLGHNIRTARLRRKLSKEGPFPKIKCTFVIIRG